MKPRSRRHLLVRRYLVPSLTRSRHMTFARAAKSTCSPIQLHKQIRAVSRMSKARARRWSVSGRNSHLKAGRGARRWSAVLPVRKAMSNC